MVRKDFNLYNFSYFFRYFLRFSVCSPCCLLPFSVPVVVIAGFGGVEAELGWDGFRHSKSLCVSGGGGGEVYFGAAAAAFLSTKMRICEFSLFLCF